MGIFSKKQNKTPPSMSEEQITKVVSKFQNWLPDDFSKEINGEVITSVELRLVIEFLVRLSTLSEDEQMLVYVGKTCAGFAESMREETVENVAQWLFDGTVVSLELRRKYKDFPEAIKYLSVVGLSALSSVEKHPKYSEILQYMSDNANKLASDQ
jgi:hypothetical protein